MLVALLLCCQTGAFAADIVSAGPAALVPEPKTSTSLYLDPVSGAAMPWSGGGTLALANASLALEHGRRVVGLACTVRDNDAEGWLRIELRRSPVDPKLPPVAETLATIETDAVGAEEAAVRRVVELDIPVDLMTWAWSLRVELRDASDPEEVQYLGCLVRVAD